MTHGGMRDLDDLLGRLVGRADDLSRRVGNLERLESPRRVPRVVVTTAAGTFASAAAVDAAFLAAAGVGAREGDGLVVHRESDDHLLVLLRDGLGAWAGVEVVGAAVGYS